jgi:hypothetical protein
LELAERSGVGALVLFKELEDFLDALRVKLLADGIQVLGLVAPELKFGQGVGVATGLKGILRVLFKDIFNLLLPVDNGG